MSNHSHLNLDPSEFPGGIAIWGAMPPVLNTTQLHEQPGVHVHARKAPGKRKQIDETFDSVAVLLRGGNEQRTIHIDGGGATAFNISEILKVPMDYLSCPDCGAAHLDKGWHALSPHQHHVCERCGSKFLSPEPVVGNPLILLRDILNNGRKTPGTVPTDRSWIHKVTDWPDGIQIWGSNEAILWTAEKPEESGIHVHAYHHDNQTGPRLSDETFGKVVIDGTVLDPQQVRYLMAQLASDVLHGHVANVICPCGAEHFSQSPLPTVQHLCSTCGRLFTTDRPVIGNPALAVMNVITESHHGRG